MRRNLFSLLVLAIVGCGDTIEHEITDAAVDAPPMGSAVSTAGLDPSPRDGSLEVLVIATSIIVAIVPLGAIRGRRRLVHDAITSKPQF